MTEFQIGDRIKVLYPPEYAGRIGYIIHIRSQPSLPINVDFIGEQGVYRGFSYEHIQLAPNTPCPCHPEQDFGYQCFDCIEALYP